MDEGERLERTADAIVQDRYAARHAPAGWLHAARYDHAFIDGELEARPIQPVARSPVLHTEAEDLARAASSHLARLVEITDVRRLHAALDELVRLDAPSTTRDDGVNPSALFSTGDRLNVVILGAGPIGLALASALLVALRPRVNVLVIDDRVSSPNHKRPYERRWLTAVDQQRFDTIADSSVQTILSRIGTKQVGATIRVLETLLLLSCRQMGARFHFAEKPDLRFIGECPVHLVVDATGNRLRETSESDAIVVGDVEHDVLDTSDRLLASYGVNTRAARHPELQIAASGDLRFPLYRGHRLAQAMVKVVGIPARLCDSLVEQVIARNDDNKFYVWRGSLKDEINEGLLIVNLTRSEYEALSRHEFPRTSVSPSGLDSRTIELVDFVHAHSTDRERAEIALDAPFVWRPYWVDERVPARLHGKPLVRIGDSIYNGNVKLANGLGPHLRHVAHIQKMFWNHATSMHAEHIARTLGSLTR